MTCTLAVFLLMSVSFALNRIPMALTAFSGLLALTVTGSITAQQAVSNIANTTTLTIAAMFVVSEGLSKTGFFNSLTSLTTRVGTGSFRKISAGFTALTFVLVQFIPSITAVFAFICPLACKMCRKMNREPAQLLYPLALVATVTAYTFTPIGPYAANFLENNGLFEQFGITGFTNTPFTEMFVKLPASAFALVWAIFFAPEFTKGIRSASIPETVQMTTLQKEPELTKFQNIIAEITFATCVISFLFRGFGLALWIIPAICACVLVLTGVLSEAEVFSHMGLQIILIYAGAASLGTAFSNTGAGEFIGGLLSSLLGNTHNSYILGFAAFITSFGMTCLIFNRATGKILVPVILSVSSSMNCDPRGLIQMCYIGSMCSLLTPMSTTLVPMLMQNGGFTQKDLLKTGWLPSLLLCVVTVGAGMTMYPCF